MAFVKEHPDEFCSEQGVMTYTAATETGQPPYSWDDESEEDRIARMKRLLFQLHKMWRPS